MGKRSFDLVAATRRLMEERQISFEQARAELGRRGARRRRNRQAAQQADARKQERMGLR